MNLQAYRQFGDPDLDSDSGSQSVASSKEPCFLQPGARFSIPGLPSMVLPFFPPRRLLFFPQTHELENHSPSFIKAQPQRLAALAPSHLTMLPPRAKVTGPATV